MFDSRTASSRGYHAIASSGQGSSYVVRHCTIISTADQFGPAFDWHGDNGDGTHGNLSSQVYANNFIISGSSSMDKFVDARGGEGLVYSNTVVGSSTRGIAVREEHPSDFPNDPLPHDLVTNMWVWANYADGQLMDTFVDDSTGILKDGVHYHTVPYTPYKQPPYPHPMAGGTIGPQTNPVIRLTPSSYDFGIVALGSTNDAKFTVQNAGGGVLSGAATVSAPFNIVGSGTYSLGSNVSQIITVRYTVPQTQVGRISQTVSFTGGGGASATVSGATSFGTSFRSIDGTITSPFVVNTDNTISQAILTTDPTQAGRAGYIFKVSEAANYCVAANVYAPDEGANSFFVNIDAEPTAPTMIWDVPAYAGFTNQFVTWRLPGTNAVIREAWSLTAGTHELIFRGREAGAKLGQITIWKVPNSPSSFRVVAAGK